MLEFQINSALRRWKNDFLNLCIPWNLVNFRNILQSPHEFENRNEENRTYLAHELIEESLADAMAMSMPLQGMNLTERVESFDS